MPFVAPPRWRNRSRSDSGSFHVRDRQATGTPRPSTGTIALVRAVMAAATVSVVTQKVDESIIGGLVLKIGDSLIDGSVKAQLETLKRKMTEWFMSIALERRLELEVGPGHKQVRLDGKGVRRDSTQLRGLGVVVLDHESDPVQCGSARFRLRLGAFRELQGHGSRDYGNEIP